jgi:acetoin utilization deacetylase AcuC-like enzyme
MISAARRAVDNGKVAVAPCSGFHHASYKHNAGFCTFNGLIIAARVMLNEGLAQKVGIVDFDMHYGDGTDQIISELDLKNHIEHYSAGKKFYSMGQSEKFLNYIPKIMSGMKDCDVILYQAGADPHLCDPFGGWLTTEQISFRDRLVFLEARRLGIPIAWNLAGGYQTDEDGSISPVLEIHDNTMKECYEVFS